MARFLVFLAIVVFVILATAVWGTLVDGTMHRPPSEWLASLYLGVFVGLLASAGLLIDQIRAHLLLAGIVGTASLALVIAITIWLWRKIKKLDELYYAKRENAPKHRSA